MVFTVSEGKLAAINKPTYQAPTSVQLTGDYTATYEELYRRQSAVRGCVEFLARNVAQLSVQTFRKKDQNDRERVTDHPYARLMQTPNPTTTGYRLMFGLIADRGIYDRALWLKTSGKDGKPELMRVPPRLWKVSDDGGSWLTPSKFVVKGSRGKVILDREQVVYFRGYNPLDERQGLSPIESLRRVLAEEWAASQMREQTLRNGARVSGYLERPQGVDWSPEARDRFALGWRRQYVGHGATDANGTPILEDGMKFVPASTTARDLQYVEARKLAREEAAAAYFIPPPMVGILDNATFGNIEEQHKMLYQDTLGPILQEVQQEIMLQLLPDFGDVDGLYSEFNMLEKLRGSFEEQAQQMSTSVGAPFLTRNEARARMNLPHIDGGDELITPLNVLSGGQASPTDSGTQNLRSRPGGAVKAGGRRSVKASDVDTSEHADEIADLLTKFFNRQRKAVLSELGKKSPDWWDADRWERELTADLFQLSSSIAARIGKDQAQALGFSSGSYDEDATLAFLHSVAKSRADLINAATLRQLEDAEADPDMEPATVFDHAVEQRAGAGAASLAVALAGFAAMEAGKQTVGRAAEKTWVVTSANPRPEHAAMDGETVGIEEKFSNGAGWPGDSVLGPDGVSGCMCDLVISYEYGGQ